MFEKLRLLTSKRPDVLKCERLYPILSRKYNLKAAGYGVTGDFGTEQEQIRKVDSLLERLDSVWYNKCKRCEGLTRDNPEVVTYLKNQEKFENLVQKYSIVMDAYKTDQVQFANSMRQILKDILDFTEETDAGNDSNTLQQKGILLKELGSYQNAEKNLEAAIALDPAAEGFYFHRGDALLREGKCSDAISYFEKARDLKPTEYGIWYWLGFAQKECKKYSDALNSFEQAIRLNPNDGGYWYQKAETCLHLERSKDALACITKAIELRTSERGATSKEVASLSYTKAQWEVRFGSIDQGLHDLGRAIQINRDLYSKMALSDEYFKTLIQDARFRNLLEGV